MSRKWNGCPKAMMLLALIVGFQAVVAVAQPAKPFGIFGNRKPNADSDFTLSQSAGPWLIMCASFVGEDGEVQAQQLCQELARDHKLKPYIYRQQFDYTRSVPGIGYSDKEQVDAYGNYLPPKPATFRAYHDSQFEEIAVLVGDFPSIDHASAQRTLEQIKHMQPKTLAGTQGEAVESTSQRMRVWREIQKTVSGNPEIKQKGPMRAAFLLPNPTIPEDYFAAPKLDAFLIKVNKQVEYSLLDCPGTWTVRVATFRGDATFDLNQIAAAEQQSRRINRGRDSEGSKLELAAHRANRIVTELRKLGVEAYEYHDRNESIACVGAFDWYKKLDANGQEIENPEVQKIVQQFSADIEQMPGQKPTMILPKTLPALKREKISFDVTPVPVLVPKTTQQVKANR